jgi:hypothetical protein
MNDVALKLGAPKTDKDTVTDQGIIIEMLVPPGKKGGKPGNSMAKMQQAAQKMMAKASKPGKGNNKADSGMAVANAQGAAKDRTNGQSSAAKKSSGATSSSEWPVEFRDALQSYFNNLDEAAKEKAN